MYVQQTGARRLTISIAKVLQRNSQQTNKKGFFPLPPLWSSGSGRRAREKIFAHLLALIPVVSHSGKKYTAELKSTKEMFSSAHVWKVSVHIWICSLVSSYSSTYCISISSCASHETGLKFHFYWNDARFRIDPLVNIYIYNIRQILYIEQNVFDRIRT